MATSISNRYLEPGVYTKIENVAAPNPIGANYIPIFVGLGRKEYDINLGVVRDDADTKDLIVGSPYTVIDILSIVDSLGVVYTKDVDYRLYNSTTNYYVEWNNPTNLTGTVTDTTFLVTGKTFKINIDGVSFTTTFATTAIADVIAEINAAYQAASGTTDDPASNDTNRIKLTGDTLVYVENGSAVSDFGFIPGQKAESKRPADAIGYTVTYKRLKLSTEYTPKIFSRLEDLYAECGPYAMPSVVVTGDVTGQSTNTLVCAESLTAVELGHYVKLTSGNVGVGQIRVISGINTGTGTITVSENWTEQPDGDSVYTIYDGPISEISIAATIAQTNGAVNFIVSQSKEDIVDDNNFRLAVDNTKELVSGIQGWCMVYLKGVDVNDSMVSYIKSYVAEMNAPINKQERMALFGIKSSMSSYTDVMLLTNGIANSRIGTIGNPFGRITGIGTLDGSYIASGVAGIICNPNYDPGEPITGKAIQGFDYIDDPWYRTEKREMGGAGAILIEKQGVDNKIIHYLSTKTDDIIDSELKVIRQIDDLKKSVRGNLERSMLNIRISNPRVIIAMADSFMRLILQSKVDSHFIAEFDPNIEIRFNPTEARELQILYRFRPALDLNYITVTMSATVA